MGRGGARERPIGICKANSVGSGLCSDEDGGLIGGASLKPADFMAIIDAANQE